MTPAPDTGRTAEEMPEALRAEMLPDAENLAVALTEAVLADGLGFKGPFEEFGRIAEPLLLDALGAARRDGAQIAHQSWEQTHRYCERQWQDERATMLDKIALLRGENDAKRTIIAAAEAEAAHLRAENANLRDRVREAEGAAEAMREACLKAAISASYGPPSSWPGPYPKGWRHPPCWEPDQRPTPDQAAWHDNGARDAWFAIRALPERS
ncbi:hypothetical protein SR39_13650 [Methylobacterium radiotolerans]|nr:hypothetical protein SR39_13650 [Methylobacterium radiotolerans]